MLRSLVLSLAIAAVAPACRPGAQPRPGSVEARTRAQASPAWLVQPATLSEIMADPDRHLARTAVVHVAVRPSHHFTLAYAGARDSHFSLEMRGIRSDGTISAGERCQGFAEKSWAAEFYEELKQAIRNGRDGWAEATLLVTYRRDRYATGTPSHLEVVGGGLGRIPDLQPRPLAASMHE